MMLRTCIGLLRRQRLLMLVWKGIFSASSRSSAAQMTAMSDLELRDLGIGRSEIPAFDERHTPDQSEDRWGNRYPVDEGREVLKETQEDPESPSEVPETIKYTRVEYIYSTLYIQDDKHKKCLYSHKNANLCIGT